MLPDSFVTYVPDRSIGLCVIHYSLRLSLIRQRLHHHHEKDEFVKAFALFATAVAFLAPTLPIAQDNTQYAEITAASAPLYLSARTSSTVVVTARRGDLFPIDGSTASFYIVLSIVGEGRYVAKNLVRVHASRPRVTASDASLRQLSAVLGRAETRATNEAVRRYPSDLDSQITWERILSDRYQLAEFHRLGVSTALKHEAFMYGLP